MYTPLNLSTYMIRGLRRMWSVNGTKEQKRRETKMEHTGAQLTPGQWGQLTRRLTCRYTSMNVTSTFLFLYPQPAEQRLLHVQRSFGE